MEHKIYTVELKATIQLNYPKNINVSFNVVGTSEEDARRTARIILDNASLSFSQPDCVEVGKEYHVASNPQVKFHGRLYGENTITSVRVYRSNTVAIYTTDDSGGDIFADWGEFYEDSFDKDVRELLSQLTLTD